MRWSEFSIRPVFRISVNKVDKEILFAFPASNFWIVGTDIPVFSESSFCVNLRLTRYVLNLSPSIWIISVFENSFIISGAFCKYKYFMPYSKF